MTWIEPVNQRMPSESVCNRTGSNEPGRFCLKRSPNLYKNLRRRPSLQGPSQKRNLSIGAMVFKRIPQTGGTQSDSGEQVFEIRTLPAFAVCISTCC
jgi:hypothetical protein